MSLKLPAKNSPVRELFDVAHLAEVAAPAVRHKLPTLGEARRQSRGIFANPKLAPKSVTYIVLRANGDLHLVTFGPRGGFRVRWNFGQ